MTDESQKNTPEEATASPAEMSRKKFIATIVGASAGIVAAGYGLDRGAEYLLDAGKAYTFDLAIETGENSKGSSTLTSEQADEYAKLATAWGNTGTDVTNKAFRDALADFSKKPKELQAPVLARLLYNAAKLHKSSLIADILGYCPCSYQIAFIGRTKSEHSQETGEGAVGIMDLLKYGRDLGMDGSYDITPWTPPELEELESFKRKITLRTRAKEGVPSILNRFF